MIHKWWHKANGFLFIYLFFIPVCLGQETKCVCKPERLLQVQRTLFQLALWKINYLHQSCSAAFAVWLLISEAAQEPYTQSELKRPGLCVQYPLEVCSLTINTRSPKFFLIWSDGEKIWKAFDFEMTLGNDDTILDWKCKWRHVMRCYNWRRLHFFLSCWSGVNGLTGKPSEIVIEFIVINIIPQYFPVACEALKC